MLKHFINKNFSKNFYQNFIISIEETFFKDKKNFKWTLRVHDTNSA
jgi:hypothetical protein